MVLHDAAVGFMWWAAITVAWQQRMGHPSVWLWACHALEGRHIQVLEGLAATAAQGAHPAAAQHHP